MRLSPLLQAVLGLAAGLLVFATGTAVLWSHPRLPAPSLARPAVAAPTTYRQLLARDHQRYAQAGDAASSACSGDIRGAACSAALEHWADVADGYLTDLRRQRVPACYRQSDSAIRSALPLVSAGSRQLVGSSRSGDPAAMAAALRDLRTGDQQYAQAIQLAAQQTC